METDMATKKQIQQFRKQEMKKLEERKARFDHKVCLTSS
jgi:hypothetical protein